jgi:hypothetical protein
MSAARWNIKAVVGPGTENVTIPTAKGRGGLAQIDDDVKNRPPRDPH